MESFLERTFCYFTWFLYHKACRDMTMFPRTFDMMRLQCNYELQSRSLPSVCIGRSTILQVRIHRGKDVVCVSRSEEPRLLSSSMLLFLQEWKGTQRFSDERRIAICLCSLWLHHSKIGPETMRRSPTVAWYLDENIQIRPSWRLRNHPDLFVVPFMRGLPMWFDFNASNWELDMMDFSSVLYDWVQLLVKSADI